MIYLSDEDERCDAVSRAEGELSFNETLWRMPDAMLRGRGDQIALSAC
jgi:hypothetical protein